jgi:hypothetical protein
MRVSSLLLSGIRDFKFAGPKPSQTRKENARKQLKVISHNHAVLKEIEKSFIEKQRVAPRGSSSAAASKM